MVTAKSGGAGRRSRDKKLKVKKETIKDLSVKDRANGVKGGNLTGASDALNCTFGCRMLTK